MYNKPIVLSGQTPSQKNEKRIAINKRTGKPFPMTDPRVKAWQKTAGDEATAWHLKHKEKQQEEKYCATYMFFVKDGRRRDLDNMIASCNDVLVKAGILEDDCWQWLAISGADAIVDSANPRAEIYLDI